jgi:hypothetical protein
MRRQLARGELVVFVRPAFCFPAGISISSDDLLTGYLSRIAECGKGGGDGYSWRKYLLENTLP